MLTALLFARNSRASFCRRFCHHRATSHYPKDGQGVGRPSKRVEVGREGTQNRQENADKTQSKDHSDSKRHSVSGKPLRR